MRIDELDYALPPDAIAQVPIEPRDAARLLVDGGPGRPPVDAHVNDLPNWLGPGDVVVVNDTRVRPARLRLFKPSGGSVEVLVLEPRGDGTWEALVRPNRRVTPGTALTDAGNRPTVVVGDELGEGRRSVSFVAEDPEVAMARVGELPLPPYITTPLTSPERYQTIYATLPGSAAAPTAGLHMTKELLEAVEDRGASVATVELAIGLGTFRPIRTELVEDHPIHAEAYRVPEATWQACGKARRVVAVGTTVVRALEAAAAHGCLSGRTDLFIRRGHRFVVVGALLTNFHQPRSSLLALLDAFVGPRWRGLYDHALGEGYRFLSFGDAMFIPSSSPQDDAG